MNEVRQVLIEAVSSKGRSRIGKIPVPALIEQEHTHRMFVVFPHLNQCRWIFKHNDPDFKVL